MGIVDYHLNQLIEHKEQSAVPTVPDIIYMKVKTPPTFPASFGRGRGAIKRERIFFVTTIFLDWDGHKWDMNSLSIFFLSALYI